MVRAMPESPVTSVRPSRWRAEVRTAAFAVLGLAVSLPVAAKPLKLYLYRDNGMPVYTNRKPENVEFTVVYPGSGAPRPVLSLPPRSPAPATLTAGKPEEDREESLIGWAASCKGVTEDVLAKRAAKWQSMVNKHAKANGVPAGLVRAVMRVESCFDVRAVSRVGARGLMQLMPATAEELGVRDSFDADQNIAGGARYLSQLLERFKNDVRLALAAYNAGPTAVDAHRGIPPFPETRNYVERVVAEYRESTSTSQKKKALS